MDKPRSLDPTPAVSFDRLRQLRPLHLLDDRSLADIVPQIELLYVDAGDSLPEYRHRALLYLQQGRLRLADAGAGAGRDNGSVLDARTIDDTAPLPISPGSVVQALRPSVLFAVPRRLIPGYDAPAAPEITLVESVRSALTGGSTDLPQLPDHGLRILAALDDPTATDAGICALIQQDPALTTRIVRLLDGTADPADASQALAAAIEHSTRAALRDLVLSCLVRGLFRSDSVLLNSRMQQLWHHSLEIGALARILARSDPQLDPDRALLAGLIHGAGELSILSVARRIPRLCADADALDRVIERLAREAAALTLGRWKLVAELVEAALHANGGACDEYAEPNYADLVLVAHLLAARRDRAARRLRPSHAFLRADQKLRARRRSGAPSAALLLHSQKEIEHIRGLLESV